MTSVLQEWVMDLHLREQGTLLTAVRGCDLTPKNPDTLNSTERRLHQFFRYCIMIPADDREVGINGAFFQSEPPRDWRSSEFGHYPLHWYTHLMHAFEVVGYRHPDHNIRMEAEAIYVKFVTGLHLYPEDRLEMTKRLSEDRIATNTVVS